MKSRNHKQEGAARTYRTGSLSTTRKVAAPQTRRSLCREARTVLWRLLSARYRGLRSLRRTLRRRLREFLRSRERGFLLRLLRDGAFALTVAGSLLAGGATAQAIELADVAAGTDGFAIRGAGLSVSGAGDVNGDGNPDFIASAPYASPV